MTAIWFILAFMTGAAVLALLWPMSRRTTGTAHPVVAGVDTETAFYEDQVREIERDLARGLIAPAEAEAARAEAARRLLRAARTAPVEADAPAIAEPHLRQRRAASAFALSTIPLVALIAYGLHGSPNLPSQTAEDRASAQSGGQELLKAVGQIEARLASDPGDARGWAVLAPVYMRLGRFDDAARAFEAVVRLKGEDAQRLSDWAEALVAAGGGQVSAEVRTILERAHTLDASAAKPQFYLARADEQAGNRAGATARLEALAAIAPTDAPWLPLVRDSLARLKGETTDPDRPAVPDAEGASGRTDAPARPAEPTAEAKPAEANAAATNSAETKPPETKPPETKPPEIKPAEVGAGAPPSASSAAPRDPPRPMAQGPATETPGRQAAPLEARLAGADRESAIRGMVEGLDRRLAAKGGTSDEWLRLVRSYDVLGERDNALAALERGRTALAGDATARERLEAQARSFGLAPAERTPEAAPPRSAPDKPDARIGTDAAVAAIRAMPAAERDTAIRAMVAALDRRLAAKGGSSDEWMQLVRSYNALGDRPHALRVLDRARMALAADAEAIERLNALGRELDLRTAGTVP